MDQSTRYEVERVKWDAHAIQAASSLSDADIIPSGMNLERYARGRPMWTGMAAFLGDLEGRRILEYGCGLGKLTVLLARSGARVTSFDLSEASIASARRRAELNGVVDRIDFHVASAEALPFDSGSFGLVIGRAILHHIDPTVGARELARVLAPGGRATFAEPLGMNPLLVFARNHLPYPGKHERGADRPLTAADMRAWREPFAEVQMKPVQLLSMVERALGSGRQIPFLRRSDEVLINAFPSLGRLCRYGILYFQGRGVPAEQSSQMQATTA